MVTAPGLRKKDDGMKGGRELKREWEHKIMDVCLFQTQNGEAVTKNNQWLLYILEFLFLEETIIDEDCYYSQSNLTPKCHQNINSCGKFQPVFLLASVFTELFKSS